MGSSKILTHKKNNSNRRFFKYMITKMLCNFILDRISYQSSTLQFQIVQKFQASAKGHVCTCSNFICPMTIRQSIPLKCQTVESIENWPLTQESRLVWNPQLSQWHSNRGLCGNQNSHLISFNSNVQQYRFDHFSSDSIETTWQLGNLFQFINKYQCLS